MEKRVLYTIIELDNTKILQVQNFSEENGSSVSTG